MKKTSIIFTILLIFTLILSGCATAGSTETKGNAAPTDSALQTPAPTPSATPSPTETAAPSPAPIAYKDGVYEGQSPMTSEAYLGKIKITVKNGAIAEVDFNIYDEKTGGKESLMDHEYGQTVFKDTPMYQEQVDNELKGMAKYEQTLIDTQDIGEVDVISKATWSYYIYQDAVKDALKDAKK